VRYGGDARLGLVMRGTEWNETRPSMNRVLGIPTQAIETATALTTWRASSGYQSRNHRNRGLAHLVICYPALAGPEEQRCNSFPNEWSVNRCRSRLEPRTHWAADGMAAGQAARRFHGPCVGNNRGALLRAAARARQVRRARPVRFPHRIGRGRLLISRTRRRQIFRFWQRKCVRHGDPPPIPCSVVRLCSIIAMLRTEFESE